MCTCVCICIVGDRRPQSCSDQSQISHADSQAHWAGHDRVCFPTPPLNVAQKMPKTWSEANLVVKWTWLLSIFAAFHHLSTLVQWVQCVLPIQTWVRFPQTHNFFLLLIFLFLEHRFSRVQLFYYQPRQCRVCVLVGCTCITGECQRGIVPLHWREIWIFDLRKFSPISGSSSGSQDEAEVWQAEAGRDAEGGPAGSQSLQHVFPRAGQLPVHPAALLEEDLTHHVCCGRELQRISVLRV